MGYTLDELANEITGGQIPASFEPTIDYVVTKIPRFNFEKFPQTDARLTTQMKSVGEVMAMGRTFQESLQKAIAWFRNWYLWFRTHSSDYQRTMYRLYYAMNYVHPGPNVYGMSPMLFVMDLALKKYHELSQY